MYIRVLQLSSAVGMEMVSFHGPGTGEHRVIQVKEGDLFPEVCPVMNVMNTHLTRAVRT